MKMPEGKNGYYDLLMKPLIIIPAPEIEDKLCFTNWIRVCIETRD